MIDDPRILYNGEPLTYNGEPITFNGDTNIKDDGDFSIISPDGPWIEDRPFLSQGDPDHRVIFWGHMCDRDFYNPLALDTLHPTISDAYLVNETGISDANARTIRFTRIYATIPSTRIEYTGTEVFKFPGLPVQSPSEAPTPITINSITSGGTYVVLNVSDADGITEGDTVAINISTLQGGVIINANGRYRVLAGSTSTQIRIPNIALGTGFVSGTVTYIEFPSRSAFSEQRPTVTRYDYFLPGVTAGISGPEDIQVDQPFRPVDVNTGEEVELLSGSTEPSATQYRAWIVDGQYLVISSDVQRYMGNIYVRETRLIKAI